MSVKVKTIVSKIDPYEINEKLNKCISENKSAVIKSVLMNAIDGSWYDQEKKRTDARIFNHNNHV